MYPSYLSIYFEVLNVVVVVVGVVVALVVALLYLLIVSPENANPNSRLFSCSSNFLCKWDHCYVEVQLYLRWHLFFLLDGPKH